MRIAFIDDEKVWRAIVRQQFALSASDALLDTFSSYPIQFDPNSYQIIICDYKLDDPDLDGLTILKKLRRQGFPGRLILYSGVPNLPSTELIADDYIDVVPKEWDIAEHLLGRADSRVRRGRTSPMNLEPPA